MSKLSSFAPQEEEPEEDAPAAGKHINPFDLQIVPVNKTEGPGFDLALNTVRQLAEIDSQLLGLAQDHLFDETGSLVDFRGSEAALSDVGSQRPASAVISCSDFDVKSTTSYDRAPSSVTAPPPSVSRASSKGRGPRRQQHPLSERGPSGSASGAPSEISERSRMVGLLPPLNTQTQNPKKNPKP